MPVPTGVQEDAVRAQSLVYLHGFASSPRSSKARFFAERAAEAGFEFSCPDLNLPEFRSLTVTRMLDQVDAVVDRAGDGPVALVGSSLGAFVALHAAVRRHARDGRHGPTIDRLILLAPALDLVPSLEEEFGDAKIRQWQQTDRFAVFHYADNAMRDLAWSFMDDARRYDAFSISLPTPTLVYQGSRDEVVAPAVVERWAAERKWVHLQLVDDGHQLLGHLDQMWADVVRFLEVDG